MAAYFAVRRQPAVQRCRTNIEFELDLPDHVLVGEYRLDKKTIIDVCDALEDKLQRSTRRSHALSVEEQVLMSLKLLASGSFQNCIRGYAQPTVSTVFDAFLNALGETAKDHIFLRSEGLGAVKQKFYEIAGFPGVIGAIDGTLIPIIAPAQNEHLYVSRKGFHALNVQAVCDTDMVFTDVVIKWPGSTHDAFILAQSELQTRFERGEFGSSLLLGDSGYPLKTWLMKPILCPISENEEKYNAAHKKTRVVIERAFGVLKQRWRILDHTGGRLCYSPLKTAKITLCCMILHNICRRNKIPLPDTSFEFSEAEETEPGAFHPTPDASAVRASIVSTFSC